MRVLLGFLLIVIFGSMWEARNERTQRAWPLLVLSSLVAAVLFTVTRLV